MRGGDQPQSDKSSHLRVSADKEIVTLTKPGSQLKQGANINNINDVFIPLQSKVNPFPSIYTLQYLTTWMNANPENELLCNLVFWALFW